MKKIPFPNALSEGVDPKQLEILDNQDYFVETRPACVQEKVSAELENAKTYDCMGWNDFFAPPVFFQGAPLADSEEGEVLIHGIMNQAIPIRYFTENGVGIATSQGLRHKMEDTHLITTITAEKKTLELTAVFDGHIAIDCAKYAKDHLTQRLEERLKDLNLPGTDFDLRLWNALKLSFVDINRLFTGKEAGCCANVCLKTDDAIWTANAGDARALLVYHDRTLQLSEDAKPYLTRYRENIEARGGYVTGFGTVAHPLSHWTIAPARSLGDHHLKGAMNPRPKITKFPLGEEIRGFYLIQACDGVFDAAATKQVAELIRLGDERGLKPARLALEIAAAAYQGGSEDNITILVKLI